MSATTTRTTIAQIQPELPVLPPPPGLWFTCTSAMAFLLEWADSRAGLAAGRRERPRAMQRQRQRGLSLPPPWQPQQQQTRKNPGVNERLANVLLHRPEKVNRPERCDYPDQPVQAFPSPSQPPNRSF